MSCRIDCKHERLTGKLSVRQAGKIWFEVQMFPRCGGECVCVCVYKNTKNMSLRCWLWAWRSHLIHVWQTHQSWLSWLQGWQCWSTHHFVHRWSIFTILWWIAMAFFSRSHVPQRMDHGEFHESLMKWNISTAVGWIAMKSTRDARGPGGPRSSECPGPLNFPPNTAGMSVFNQSCQISQRPYMDWRKSGFCVLRFTCSTLTLTLHLCNSVRRRRWHNAGNVVSSHPVNILSLNWNSGHVSQIAPWNKKTFWPLARFPSSVFLWSLLRLPPPPNLNNPSDSHFTALMIFLFQPCYCRPAFPFFLLSPFPYYPSSFIP